MMRCQCICSVEVVGGTLCTAFAFHVEASVDHLARNSLSYVTENSGMPKLRYRKNCLSSCRRFFLLRLGWRGWGSRTPTSRPAHIKGAAAARAAAFLLPPPQKIGFSAGMGGPRGCKRPQQCRGCGFGSPAARSAPCTDAAEGSGGVCAAVGPRARGMENRRRGFALAFTRSWIQPSIPLPGPSLLSAIKPCVSLKVNDEAVHLS